MQHVHPAGEGEFARSFGGEFHRRGLERGEVAGDAEVAEDDLFAAG